MKTFWRTKRGITNGNGSPTAFLKNIGRKFENQVLYEEIFSGLSPEASIDEGRRILESAEKATATPKLRLSLLGRAASHFKHALALKPESDLAHRLLGKSLFLISKTEAEVEGCRESARPFLLTPRTGRLRTTGVLLIHDFGATPRQMRALGEFLHNKGYAVYGVRLAGHGRNHQAIEHTSPNDWFASAEQGFYILNEFASKIAVIGQGIGAILALLLAAHIREINAVVALAAPVRLKSFWVRFYPVLSPLVRYRFQKQYHENPEAYHRYVPTGSVAAIKQLVKEYPEQLRRISCPLLLIHSLKDDFSDAKSSAQFIKEKSNAHICRIAHLGNKYVLTEKNRDQGKINELIASFIEEVV